MKNFLKFVFTLLLVGSASSAFAGGYFFNRDLVSFYTVNGQEIDADINFNGSQGTFDTGDGRMGYFSNVVEWSDGKVITGYWQKNGQGGTFRFEMFYTDTGEFEGTWKDNNGGNGEWFGADRETL